MQNSWPVIRIGKPGQPPIVFLHGFLGEGQDWLPVAQKLSDNYQSILVDLPGHGLNQRLPAASLSFDLLVAGLLETLDGLSVSRFNLVGYSLGGRLALHTAIHIPTRVRALVLESASPGIDDPKQRADRQRLDAERAAKLLMDGMPAFLEEWYTMPLFASLRGKPGLLIRLKASRKELDPQIVARVLTELSPGGQPSHRAGLQSLSMPVLLLAGALDSKYSADLSQIAALIPDARFDLCPDAGHNLHLENPDWLLEKLADFLNQCTG